MRSRPPSFSPSFPHYRACQLKGIVAQVNMTVSHCIHFSKEGKEGGTNRGEGRRREEIN